MIREGHGFAVAGGSDIALCSGITRHAREGLNFKRRAEEGGWKRAVEERDQGTFDWTRYESIKFNR